MFKIRTFIKRYGMVITFLILIILGALLSDRFLTTRNLLNIARQVSIIGLLATGETFAILSGGIDLSVGGVLSATAIFVACMQFLPFPLIVILAIMFASVFGFTSGNLVARAKLTPFIATIGIGTVADGTAFLLANGQPIFIQNNAEIFSYIGNGSILGIPIPAIVLVVCIIIGQVILSCTSAGVYMKALGGNEEATFWSGVNTKRYRVLAFVLAAVFTSIAAILAVSRTSVGDPVIGQGLTIDAISAVVIGGTHLGGGGVGSVTGTLLGAFVMGIINNLFNLLNVNAYLQLVAKGTIIIGAVYIGTRKGKE